MTVCAIFTLDMHSSTDTAFVQNFRTIRQLFMEILHFKDLGDTENVVMNAVVLVLGECQISMAKYLRGVSTLI